LNLPKPQHERFSDIRIHINAAAIISCTCSDITAAYHQCAGLVALLPLLPVKPQELTRLFNNHMC
jgi:hypothetical protein